MYSGVIRNHLTKNKNKNISNFSVHINIKIFDLIGRSTYRTLFLGGSNLSQKEGRAQNKKYILHNAFYLLQLFMNSRGTMFFCFSLFL